MNRNPNIAFRDRNRRDSYSPMIIKFAADHLVTFTCPKCLYTYDNVFVEGTSLNTKYLCCLECGKAEMAYYID